MKYVLALVIEEEKGSKYIRQAWDCKDFDSLKFEYSKQEKFLKGKFKAYDNITKRDDPSKFEKYREKIINDLLFIFGDEEIKQFYFQFEQVPESLDDRVALFNAKYPECVPNYAF